VVCVFDISYNDIGQGQDGTPADSAIGQRYIAVTLSHHCT
jgi:hypothetical protein